MLVHIFTAPVQKMVELSFIFVLELLFLSTTFLQLNSFSKTNWPVSIFFKEPSGAR